MYGLRRTSVGQGPALEPAMVKRHLRITGDEDDAYVFGELVPSAVAEAELATHRQLLTATWELTRDAFPCQGEPLNIPLPPLVGEPTITYLDTNGAQQTWNAANWDVTTHKEPAEIWPAYGKVWPTTRPVAEAVKVTFTCGYGADWQSIPVALREAMYLLVAHRYMNREAVITDTIATVMPLAIDVIFERMSVGDDFTNYDVQR
jgi:uncharacterized phiE125 gp8 family phage protein